MKSLRGSINAKCKDCIYQASDPEVLGSWREQVTVCSCIDCPLWVVRPITNNAPAWLTSHDPADLPADWVRKPHNDCVRLVWEAKRGGREGTIEPEEGSELENEALDDPTS